MEKALLEETVGEYVCRVFHDDSSSISPEDFDHVGKLMTFHRDCYIQVERKFKRKEEEFKAFLRDNENNLIIMPVYAYIHSGVALSLERGGQFNDPWDSGQIGVIYCTKEEAAENFGKNYSERLLKCFKAIIEEWDGYLSGNVYGYTVERNGEDVDSCWGFIGTPQEVMKTAKESAAFEEEAELKKHGEQLKLIKA